MAACLLANVSAEEFGKIEIPDDSLPVVTLKPVCPRGSLVLGGGERMLNSGDTVENLLYFVAHSA